MNKITFEKIRENLYETTLENGLKVFYIEKKGFEKSFAMLSTNFGSVDSIFTVDGEETILPNGVAHFLEHKVFEQKEGNALQMFAKTGASPNAFTSNSMTAYYFGCTDGFFENLKILLTFVYNPYFTDENVEKEQGIIAQEIAMIGDNPNWQVYQRVLEGLYETHPVRHSIAGSVDSIAKIDKELLYKCHKTFYDPSNMVLCISGDVDIEKAIEMAKEITPESKVKVSTRKREESLETAYKSKMELSMQVSMPIFMLGFKDSKKDVDFAYELLAELALKYLCSKSRAFYTKLNTESLISSGIDFGYTSFAKTGVAMIGAESRVPDEAYKEILKEIHNISVNGVDDGIFTGIKKAAYGANIRSLNSPEDLCVLQTSAYFSGKNYFDFAEIYDKITKDDIREFWTKFDDKKLCTLSVVSPRE